ncbi:histone-like nucleoid-structuring protein Lsr2 [Streptomyces achromogenes]|uniref:Lsr2 family DNA-binding protein n=1 Tax=Streptomyces achromogenes TaxID=67255 RepID=UPI003700EEDC
MAQRLAEIRARKGELEPAKPKKTRRPVDYPVAEVRAWAAATGVDCPPRGRVPKAVVEAWRAAQQQSGA